MNKVIITSLILSILTTILLYLAFSFAYNNLNISHWDIGGRSMCAFMMFSGIIGSVVFPFVNYYDNIKK